MSPEHGSERAAPAVARPGRIAHGVALAVYAAGFVVRALFVLRWHKMTDYIYSDMGLYDRLARAWMDPRHRFTIEDTIYPPGAPYFFGYLWKLDPTWYVASLVQLAMTAAVPILVFEIAEELYDRRIALLSLVVSSVFLPLFVYAGYMLSENPFTFFMLLAFFLLVRSFRPSARWRTASALAAGITLGIATSFKSPALPAALLVGAIFALAKRLGAVKPLAVAVLGLSLVLVPLAVRATRLSEGRFCLVANETGRGILIGHHGEIFRAFFDDNKRGYFYEFGYSAAIERHKTGSVRVPVGPWDNSELVHEAWEWTRAHPWESARLGFEHVFDLFISMPWPSGSDPKIRPWDIAFQRGYQPLLLFPAGFEVALALFMGWRRREERGRLTADMLVLAPIAGITVSAFIAVGESRYRAPFDGFLVLLAMAGYVRMWELWKAWRSNGPSHRRSNGGSAPQPAAT